MVQGLASNVLDTNEGSSSNLEDHAEKGKYSTSYLPSPYIKLMARLSQVWLNQYAIMLLLLVFRLSFTLAALRENLANSEEAINVSCLEVQAIASIVASMPHYFVVGSNALVKNSIDSTITGFATLLIKLLTAVEAVIEFVVASFRSTYTCLLKMAVDGSLAAIIQTTDAIGETVNATMSVISDDLSSAICDANAVLQQLDGVVSTLTAVIGEKVSIPTLTLPTIQGLGGMYLLAPFEASVRELRAHLSTGLVENTTDTIVALPFVELKQTITDTLLDYSFDASLLESPQVVQFTLCPSSQIQTFFVSLNDDMHQIYVQIVAGLIFCGLLTFVFNIWIQCWRWRAILKLALATRIATDSVDSVLIAISPIRAKFREYLQSTAITLEKQYLAQWLITYISHTPIAYVFSLVLVGSLSITLQIIMQRKFKTLLATQDMDTSDIYKLVDSSLVNSSKLWTQAANLKIASIEQDLNTKLFGWVRNATSVVNATLNEFTNELVSTLNFTFQGTILYEPAIAVMDCVLLLKIQGIEGGLTWVHNQAHIELPLIPSTILNLSSTDQSVIMQRGSDATSSLLEKAMTKVMQSWQSSMKREIFIITILLGIWSFVVLCGLLRVILFSKRAKIRSLLETHSFGNALRSLHT